MFPAGQTEPVPPGACRPSASSEESAGWAVGRRSVPLGAGFGAAGAVPRLAPPLRGLGLRAGVAAPARPLGHWEKGSGDGGGTRGAGREGSAR